MRAFISSTTSRATRSVSALPMGSGLMVRDAPCGAPRHKGTELLASLEFRSSQTRVQSSWSRRNRRRVLEAAPDHPRALHYAGLLAHQQGRNGEALALIERSLALAPDQADWCSN